MFLSRPFISTVAAAFCAITATSATAATFIFDAVVTESVDATGLPDRPDFDLPNVGTMGTIEIVLGGLTYMGSTDIPDEFAGVPASFLDATATAGFLSASLLDGAAAIIPFPDGFRISNGSFSGISVSVPSTAGQTLAGSFNVLGVAGSGTPMTLADVDSLLRDPTSLISFTFNGTVNGSTDFVSFRMEAVAPVPLPAGAALLLTGLGALALRKRLN